MTTLTETRPDTGPDSGPRAGPDPVTALDRAERIVADVQTAFETAVDCLRDTLSDLRSCPGGADREVVKDLKAMNAAFLLALQMQEKARDAGSQRFGSAAPGGDLDLAAARAEIALRLACLRSAR